MNKILKLSLIKFLLIYFLYVFAQPAVAKAENIAVIVNSKSEVAELDKATVKRIFLGKKRKVNGVRLKILDLKKSDAKKLFYKKIAGYSLAKLRKYWAKRIFTGKGNPPKKYSSSAAKRLISKDRNAIGFIKASEVDSSVRVVLEI